MLEGNKGVEEYTIEPKRLNGYQITRPVKVTGFWMKSWRPGFHLQYEFRALGESMGVIGSNYAEAEQLMYEALIDLYADLTRSGYDSRHVTDEEKLVNALGRADLSTFIMPMCLPLP